MSKQSELKTLESRRNRLMMNGKNVEGRGVLRKIERKIRNLQKDIANQ